MRRRLFAAALLIPAVLLGATPAVADQAHPRVVSANPVDFTPHVLDGMVWSIAVVGDTVVVGGSFSRVANSRRTQTYARKNIFAYGLRDGVIRPFAPAVDGSVFALAPGVNGTVYLGGSFKTVNGAAQRGLARLTLTGQRVTSFAARIGWGDVRALSVRGSRLYAGGTFPSINGVNRVALARIHASTGALDRAFDARLSAPGLDRTRVEHFDVSPDGRKLIAVGALLRAGTFARTQIVMLDVGGPTAQVANWYTNAYRPRCKPVFDTYLRQVKFSPDARYFVVVSTGQASSPTLLCDSAARFETAGLGLHNPTWVQRTGGDSLYAVAVTGAAVYVGGHQRYLNNPYGTDAGGAGAGAVQRIGIGALNPLTGRALAWNPGLERGVGIRTFVATPGGLLAGYDTQKLGGEYHARLGMFPLA
jgi:hypothetical protein